MICQYLNLKQRKRKGGAHHSELTSYIHISSGMKNKIKIFLTKEVRAGMMRNEKHAL